MSQIAAKDIQQFTQVFGNKLNSMLESESPESIGQVHQLVDALITSLRQVYQEMIKDKAQNILNCLKQGKCAPAEIEYLKKFVVGEAMAYTGAETGYESWKQELKASAQQLGSLNASQLADPEAVFALLGQAKVLLRTLEDMNFYASEQQRIRMFEDSIADGIDKVEATVLSDIVQYKMAHKTH